MKTIYDVAQRLLNFWASKGAAIIPTYDKPVGAATFHPDCFFGSLSKDPLFIAYIQPSRRKSDGRFGLSPNRFYIHHQVQVFMKPANVENVENIENVENGKKWYLESLDEIGLGSLYINFVENNWTNESIGAFGKGWEVRCEAMEITQKTYFHRIGDVELEQVPLELAYGLERCALFSLNKDSVWDLDWDRGYSYKHFLQREREFSKYCLDVDPVVLEDFYRGERKVEVAIENGVWIPAYEACLDLNDIFNGLDSRKLINQVERRQLIQKLRLLANRIAIGFKKNNKNNQ